MKKYYYVAKHPLSTNFSLRQYEQTSFNHYQYKFMATLYRFATKKDRDAWMDKNDYNSFTGNYTCTDVGGKLLKKIKRDITRNSFGQQEYDLTWSDATDLDSDGTVIAYAEVAMAAW
jgi:hypothetical protein